MDIEKGKSEQRIQLTRQHRSEWDTCLAFETETRTALYARHEQERSQLYEEEINFHERAALTTRQLGEVNDLKHQDRETRISTQKRHTQEKVALDQLLG